MPAQSGKRKPHAYRYLCVIISTCYNVDVGSLGMVIFLDNVQLYKIDLVDGQLWLDTSSGIYLFP